MEAVRAYIAELDIAFDHPPPSIEKQQVLCELVNVVATKADKDQPMSVDALRYGIYLVAFSESNLDQTTIFLDILVSLELQRRVYLKMVEDYFPSLMIKGGGNNAFNVSQEHRDILVRMKSSDLQMRGAFIQIIQTCIAHHLYHIWINSEKTFAGFWLMFKEYFPSSTTANKSTRRFYRLDMTADELAQIDMAMRDCIVNIAEVWAAAHRTGNGVCDSLRSEQFRNEYPHEFMVSPGGLRKLIKEYVDTIHEGACVVDQILPD